MVRKQQKSSTEAENQQAAPPPPSSQWVPPSSQSHAYLESSSTIEDELPPAAPIFRRPALSAVGSISARTSVSEPIITLNRVSLVS